MQGQWHVPNHSSICSTATKYQLLKAAPAADAARALIHAALPAAASTINAAAPHRTVVVKVRIQASPPVAHCTAHVVATCCRRCCWLPGLKTRLEQGPDDAAAAAAGRFRAATASAACHRAGLRGTAALLALHAGQTELGFAERVGCVRRCARDMAQLLLRMCKEADFAVASWSITAHLCAIALGV